MYNRQEMRRALESRDWSRIRKSLDSCNEPPAEVNRFLLEDTIHSGCLIEQRHQDEDVARRGDLLLQLRERFETSGDVESQERLDEHLQDAALIERCYAEIRQALKTCVMAAHTPQEQAWAAVARLVGEIKHLHKQLADALASRKGKGTVFFLDSNPWGVTGPTGKAD
jgi:hypothetical protein